ncbi:MAG: TAXI family TRAP transporter solute-binding subunit [Oscillospiraceae bacterium]|nr:TAXI family TRAP transporter solute-binding subunit [Oscillospiraceae bacterium]
MTKQHAKGGELDLDFAAGVTSVPYHPGAAKYFAEKGHTVASVKDGAGTGAKADLTFGTGGDTGTYYGYGSVLANYVSGNTDFTVTAVTSGGSKANIEDMAANDVQLGFAQSDVMSYAYNGQRLFEEALTGFSVVAALYMEQVQIVTTNSSIASVADLKGKTVSIGAVGSGVYFNAVDVLDAYGMTESDIKPVYQSFGDSADSLKDGKIDAAFIVAGAPTTAITDLAASGSVYLVSIDKAHADSLMADNPFYSTYTIPAGTY